MNAKEQIIQVLKEKILNTIRFGNENYIQQLERLIIATESAIFDMPSEDEIEKQIIHQYDYWVIGFKDGINFILNYNKPKE